MRTAPANTTDKKQIARLIAQYDGISARCADAILRGQEGLADRRLRAMRRLAKQIRNTACKHNLITWTRTRLTAN